MEVHGMSDSPRRKPYVRFSIAALLFAMLCLGGYLTGYRAGYDAGKESAESGDFIQVVYPVADLLPTASSTSNDYDALIDQIVSTVSPASWMENGTGDGELQPFPSNKSIVVSQNKANHKLIAAELEQLRASRSNAGTNQADR
jgi:hypothetical protein